MNEGKSSNGQRKSILIFLVIFILLSPLVKFANSSILAGAFLTIFFSACFFFWTRSIGPKGARIFRAQGIILLLLVSLICAIPGLAIIHYSGYLNRRLVGDGVLITFGGMILGAIIFSILANYFWQGEKRHFKEDLSKKRTHTRDPLLLLQRRIKTRAFLVRTKSHPYKPILFCLVGWIVGIAMVIGGLFGDQSVGFTVLGSFISLAYTCALVWIFVRILRGKWDSDFNTAIEKADLEIKRLEEQASSLSEQK